MRKRNNGALLLTALLLTSLLSLCASGCSRRRSGRADALYVRDVLTEVTKAAENDGRLDGIAEGRCIVEDESIYDPELINVPYCALFSADSTEVIYAKGVSERIYPASLTKVMTALLTVEHCEDLSERVEITEEMLSDIPDGASLAGLEPGMSCTVQELLYALMVPSGNDAANALAVYVAGSTEDFAALMNRRAKELGMLNTHFANAHGMHDKNHYTTVYDLYLLTKAAAEYPDLKTAASTAEISVYLERADGTTVQKDFLSGNSFLRRYTVPPEGVSIGFSKTGYTVKAGRCLIMYCRDNTNGRNYIAIVAKADTYDGLYEHMNELLSLIPGAQK